MCEQVWRDLYTLEVWDGALRVVVLVVASPVPKSKVTLETYELDFCFLGNSFTISPPNLDAY